MDLDKLQDLPDDTRCTLQQYLSEGQLEFFKILLLHNSKYSLLPEILDCIGPSTLIKFMDIFGGRTIVVPSLSELTKSLREADIFISIKKEDSPDSVKRLCIKYGMDKGQIYRIFNAVDKKFGLIWKEIEDGEEV